MLWKNNFFFTVFSFLICTVISCGSKSLNVYPIKRCLSQIDCHTSINSQDPLVKNSFHLLQILMNSRWWMSDGHILNADTHVSDFLCKTLNICVSSDWVQPRDEASLLCERDHAQPEQQEPAVRHWQTHNTDTSHDFHSKSTWIINDKKINAPVCSQDQSSGSGAAGSGVPGEGGPWHHSLSLRQLQGGSYSLLWISSQTMWWSCFLFFYKIVETEYERGVAKVAWGYDYVGATKNGKVPLRPHINIMRVVWSSGADSGIMIYLRRTTTGRCNVCLRMRCLTEQWVNNKTRKWK